MKPPMLWPANTIFWFPISLVTAWFSSSANSGRVYVAFSGLSLFPCPLWSNVKTRWVLEKWLIWLVKCQDDPSHPCMNTIGVPFPFSSYHILLPSFSLT